VKIYRAFFVLLFMTLSLPVFGEDVISPIRAKQILKTSTSWNQAPLAYPTGTPEVTGLTIEIAPGAETGWHLHPMPCLAVILQGTLEVSLKDGQVKHLVAGDMLAEVVNTLHNGRNVGTDPVKLAVFFLGAQGQTLTVKEADVVV
jgi:quercetin dioxygenase-like cupin family protein